LRKKLINCYIWSINFYGAGTWTLRKLDYKYLKSSEPWCSRRMKRIFWTDHVRNEEVLQRAKEEVIIIPTIKKEG
jgi:hypothetical protein